MCDHGELEQAARDALRRALHGPICRLLAEVGRVQPLSKALRENLGVPDAKLAAHLEPTLRVITLARGYGDAFLLGQRIAEVIRRGVRRRTAVVLEGPDHVSQYWRVNRAWVPGLIDEALAVLDEDEPEPAADSATPRRTFALTPWRI
jgi:hypothetical protein